MAKNKKPLDPAIYVTNDKGESVLVEVGPLSWSGVKELIDQIAKADLPLPSLGTASVANWIKGQQDDLSAIDPSDGMAGARLALAHQRQNLGLYQALIDLLTENLNVLYAWALKHPPIAEALVAGGSGLTPAQIDELSAGEFLRIARASWQSLVDNGVLSEIASFFGGLLPLNRPGAAESQPSGADSNAAPEASADAPASTAASASESSSASPA